MASMVIEVPEELKDLGEAMDATLAAVKESLRRAAGGKALDYEAVECAIADAAAQVERAGHRAVLQALDVDRPAVTIGGARYARVGRAEATYYTLAGPVVIQRSLYRECGQRNARVVDAVSLRAGVVEDGWLPRTARAMAHQLQQATSREAEETARELRRLPYSRSSFERVGHAVGALYVPRRADIEDALIEEQQVPAQAHSISVSLDRVNVPMEEPRPRPRGRPKKGAAKRPVARNFRQAYCGAITLHDVEGEALHSIRYGRMPQGDVESLCEGMAGDVWTLLGKRPDLKVEILCDGAPEMWNRLEAQLVKLGVEVHELVDLHHLVGKLGAAARVIDGEAGAGATVQRWKLRLLNRASAAEEILGELVASGREQVAVGEERPVHDAITYLESHSVRADRMNYARARRLGLPLGSGNVEATCKSLFEVRMKRAGSRWKEDTGEHVVQLRALALSERWERGIELTLAPLRRAVRPAA